MEMRESGHVHRDAGGSGKATSAPKKTHEEKEKRPKKQGSWAGELCAG